MQKKRTISVSNIFRPKYGPEACEPVQHEPVHTKPELCSTKNCNDQRCPFPHSRATLGVCEYGLSCRNTRCTFAHPYEGQIKRNCKYGLACKNAKCMFVHPGRGTPKNIQVSKPEILFPQLVEDVATQNNTFKRMDPSHKLIARGRYDIEGTTEDMIQKYQQYTDEEKNTQTITFWFTT